MGRKLSHSYSPLIHSCLGNYSYELFERDPDDLRSLLDQKDLRGFNVTIPYKKDIIPYLDELSPTAQKLGAVNTVVRTSEGKLYGHNTDHYGFHQLINKSGIDVTGKKVLVLGSGGASNTVVHVLKERNAQPVIISRSGEYHYGNLEIHKDAQVIVNTTPVGMYPDTDASPVDLGQFPQLEGVIDLIYNPCRTRLLLDAEEYGIPNINGLWMLVAQAKASAELFLGTKLQDSIIGKIHHKLDADMRNIILIGMPG
ncbi:MAG: shikimate dehydrogenase, partial [Lentisphaeria bacterium]|nr:shikimate dehydrogenase [Lentisphaeria bacterium]